MSRKGANLNHSDGRAVSVRVRRRSLELVLRVERRALFSFFDALFPMVTIKFIMEIKSSPREFDRPIEGRVKVREWENLPRAGEQRRVGEDERERHQHEECEQRHSRTPAHRNSGGGRSKNECR